jgi:peptidyl-prolyl cis-trans isomerase C
MKHFQCGLVLSLLTGVLAACGQAQSPAAPEVPPAERIATVNGKAISQKQFEMYVSNIERQANGRRAGPEERAKLLERFIGMHLAAQDGEKLGLDKQQQTAEQLAYSRASVLSDAAMQKYLDEHPIRDEELKPAYDEGVAKLPPQYHTFQILVDDPVLAADLIKQLKAGANFAKLAKKHSTDLSKDGGGDVGWRTPEEMPPSYAEAVAKLQPGEITEQPVQSGQGWHVIRLEEKRPQDVAPFEDVKDKVMLLVKQQRLNAYMESLRKEAKVDAVQRGPKT